MGDRGNIIIREEGAPDLFLYTHWEGSRIPSILADALDRGQGRWTDAPYLARIIFCEMVRGMEREETGFGISTRECDNEHTIPVVDVTKGRVELDGGISFTFREFIAVVRSSKFGRCVGFS